MNNNPKDGNESMCHSILNATDQLKKLIRSDLNCDPVVEIFTRPTDTSPGEQQISRGSTRSACLCKVCSRFFSRDREADRRMNCQPLFPEPGSVAGFLHERARTCAAKQLGKRSSGFSKSRTLSWRSNYQLSKSSDFNI